MNSHRVEVLNRTDDHNVVIEVTHDLHLVLFPTNNRLFDQDFGGWRLVKTTANEQVEFIAVVSDRRTASAHREARTDQAGKTDFFHNLAGVGHSLNRFAVADVQAARVHGLLESIAVFRFVDRISVGSDHLDAMFFQNSFGGEVHGQVERRLATQCWQQRVRFFFGNDLFYDLPFKRLDISPFSCSRVGHDGGRV